MGAVTMFAAVSLDGLIADDQDHVGPLFDWYTNGDVPVHVGDEERVFHTSAATADFLRTSVENISCIVQGRRQFDLTNGWNGRPAAGDHVFVVTHEPPTDWAYSDTAPYTFVTEGVEAAVARARAYAGERDVSLVAGDVGGQALRLGLVDRVVLNLVPVVLGSGVSFFGTEGLAEPLLFEDPRVIEGSRVTHLVFDARR